MTSTTEGKIKPDHRQHPNQECNQSVPQKPMPVQYRHANQCTTHMSTVNQITTRMRRKTSPHDKNQCIPECYREMLLIYAFGIGLRQARQPNGARAGEEDKAIQMTHMLKNETAIPTPDDSARFWVILWFPAEDYPRQYKCVEDE
mmetsp:Transcript_27903/g.51422  ORF Transcript_27903/g.51422 Transcript_27903/m.51422 type:complete len:145 (+) Transcript_27903:517-951(+)